MGIYDAPELTKDEKLIALKRSIAGSKLLVEQLKNMHLSAFNRVWNNPDHTPQEIMDAYGTDAAKLFHDSAATQTFLSEVVDGYEPLTPPRDYTINQDGSVTIL